MINSVEERYEELRVRFGLPEYTWIDHEFEIFTLEEEKYLLRAIKDRIAQKIDDYVKIIEDLLNFDSSSFSSIYETRTLTDPDKEKILKLHQKLMILLRKALEISIDNNEIDIAAFIKDIADRWDSFKPPLKDIARSLQIAWQTENFEEEKQQYMG